MWGLMCLDRIFQSSKQIVFDDSSKIVLMSDCHRGDGGLADEFSKNQNIYFAALNHYYNENYTYIEIGDGDELWKNKNYSDIIKAHKDVFWILSKFYNENRLYFIYGNHDIIKRNKTFVKNNLYRYYDERSKKYIPLFEDIEVYEGLVLVHKLSKDKIFLVHGHQVDFLNYNLWMLSRFLVRYILKPMEILGANDITSPAKNYSKKIKVEEKLAEWAAKEKQMLIAGHTHRPMFPDVGEPLYFNDGSSVHPRFITALEITNGYIALVKWSVKVGNNGTLFIGRDVLADPRRLKDYFNKG